MIPNDTNQAPIQIAWINYVSSVKLLLGPQINDRPLDQFLTFRDNVYAIVLDRRFLDELREGSYRPSNMPEIQDALLLELQSFSRAVEIAKMEENQSKSKKQRTDLMQKLLGRASTVTGSVSDIFENLPPLAKNGLTLFKELIDLFRGRD
jgi:hypothetical protein